jgi:hypothetical protein
MDSLARPLRQLYEDTSWFVRARELRLLHVTCSPSLRASALRVLLAGEFHAQNRSPFIAFEDTYTANDRGWRERSLRLGKHWEERFSAAILDGFELGELDHHAPATGDDLAAFAVWLARVLDALRAPLHGAVVVLAPTRVEDPNGFERELGELVARRELRDIRWIVLQGGDAPLGGLIEHLAASALSARCAEDPAAFDRDLSDLGNAIDPIAVGPARGGAAWPRGVLPPSRPGDRLPSAAQEEQRDLELAAAGINAVLAGPDGARMQQHMILGAVAARRGSGAEACGQQSEAVRIAYEAGATREALLQHLALAGYYHAFGYVAEAEREYTAIAQRAAEWECAHEAAQAHLALGLLAANAGRSADGATHYAQAAEAAERGQAATLAIECWRLSGQLALQVGLEKRAIESWKRALSLVREATVELAKASSAADAAHQLASLLRERGQIAQADSLDYQANQLKASGLAIDPNSIDAEAN